jgi:hypothetical protein
MFLRTAAALLGSNPHTGAHSLGGGWSKAGLWMTVAMCVVPILLFVFFWWYIGGGMWGEPGSEPAKTRRPRKDDDEPVAAPLKQHDRERVLRDGIATKATVVSMTPVRELARGTDVYAMVFRIRRPWRWPLRVRGAEVLTDSDPRDLRVRQGESVEVRFDLATREVVVVGLDSEDEKWARLFGRGRSEEDERSKPTSLV